MGVGFLAFDGTEAENIFILDDVNGNTSGNEMKVDFVIWREIGIETWRFPNNFRLISYEDMLLKNCLGYMKCLQIVLILPSISFIRTHIINNVYFFVARKSSDFNEYPCAFSKNLLVSPVHFVPLESLSCNKLAARLLTYLMLSICDKLPKAHRDKKKCFWHEQVIWQFM